MVWLSFIDVYQELYLYHGTNHKVNEERYSLLSGPQSVKKLGIRSNRGTWKWIPPNWQLEFHVHTYASLFAIGAMLAHNTIGKYDQPKVYAFRLLNKVEKIILL